MGGMPPLLGGGGLELQIETTQRELVRLGHSVVRVENATADHVLDLVHAFGSEPDNWHRVRNWYRNRAPLVVTPVISISTRGERVALRAGARLPAVMSSARMRRELLDAADAIVALTDYERGLVVNEIGADASRVHVIENGVALPQPHAASEEPLVGSEPFCLMVGRVSAWKRQADVLEAVAGRHRLVVAGALEDEASEPSWRALVERTNATWLGAVAPEILVGLYRRADALVHLSVGEVQSLAVLEALSQGAPVIASRIPAHEELLAAHGRDWMRLVEGPEHTAAAIDELRSHRPSSPPPRIRSAGEAAAELVSLYRRVLS